MATHSSLIHGTGLIGNHLHLEELFGTDAEHQRMDWLTLVLPCERDSVGQFVSAISCRAFVHEALQSSQLMFYAEDWLHN